MGPDTEGSFVEQWQHDVQQAPHDMVYYKRQTAAEMQWCTVERAIDGSALCCSGGEEYTDYQDWDICHSVLC
jgi:hypothetical protein